MNKKIFSVNSSPDYFDDEITMVKNNTVRFTDDWSPEKWDSYYHATHLHTTNTETNESFLVEIRHKCTYKNIAIITTAENNI